MTLLEALEDIGKGRIIDNPNACEYRLVALARGIYSFYIWQTGETVEIELTGTPTENAEKIEKEWYKRVQPFYQDSITRAAYRKK